MASMCRVSRSEGTKVNRRRHPPNDLSVSWGTQRTRLGGASRSFFDTIRIWLAGDRADHLLERATANGINLRKIDDHAISLTLDETMQDISVLLPVFDLDPAAISAEPIEVIGSGLKRESEFLSHPVFNKYHTETELLRYIRRLESRDLSLTTSMIPLGSSMQ